MESVLLCDEVWVCSPATPTTFTTTCSSSDSWDKPAYVSASFRKQDCEEALSLLMEKEATNYIPQPAYIKRLHRSSSTLSFARSRATHWLLKACSRLNLSVSTLFSACDYLDRFMSMHRRLKWETWMVELVAVTCLTVAAKFSETASTAPSLDDIQMEEMDHCFERTTTQQMELLLLQTLQWRLGSATSYSYAELLVMNISDSSPQLCHDELFSTTSHFLLRSMLEWKFLEYRPSSIAISAVWCSLQVLASSKQHSGLSDVITTRLFQQSIHNNDDVLRCREKMMAMDWSSRCSPGSPVTVLSRDRGGCVDDSRVDISIFRGKAGASGLKIKNKMKRKWDET